MGRGRRCVRPGGDDGPEPAPAKAGNATSDICSALLVVGEGTASTFAALLEVFTVPGLPCSLDTDRGSHDVTTLKAGGPVHKDVPAQVGRALGRLGMEHIAAYAPQARGRWARAFRTLQDRLPKDLALAGIATVDAAEAHLRERDLPPHNARFAVKAAEPGSAFPPTPGVDLREVLCHEEERGVGHDNTGVPHKVRLHIPPSPLRAHFVRTRVRVRRYGDGSHAIFHGPRCIGRHDAKGEQNRPQPTTRAAA